MFDKQLELAALDNVVTTAAETGVSFAATMAGNFEAIVYVTAAEFEGSPEPSYRVSIETDSVAAFTDAPVEVGTVDITGPGIYHIALTGTGIAALDPDAAAIRVKATLTEAEADLTYGAYLIPMV